MKEVILDTETTGLSVKDGHRIVEIGCIELENFVPTSNKFHFYLNPERKVSEKALEVHGYTDEFLSDKKKFFEIADQFLEFIKDKKIIIHNASFDLSFINYELKLARLKKIDKERSNEALIRAQSRLKDKSMDQIRANSALVRAKNRKFYHIKIKQTLYFFLY